MLGSRHVLAGAAALLTLAAAGSADAFSTRLHIKFSNDLRDELVASGNNTIPLRFTPYSVTLTAQDAQAIIDNPLEFRAGAIGPDNTAFPGMTDPSHAVEQRPFEQCELLYQEAILGEERAYALGCFLHGATDAVAHHYVNYMTGETFTLNPLSAAREMDFDNVVRHIVAESQIQKAAYTAQPGAFGNGMLSHRIPKAFVLRSYYDTSHPLWQMMAARANAEFEAARTANPGASLVTLIVDAGLAPADHLVMAPIYLQEADVARVDVRAGVEARIAELQNPGTTDGATLGVTAGSDGVLGTSDDDTACTLTCAQLYATYKVYVSLLEPRFDAMNMPLPSAFDKISDKLREDLFKFLPAYMDVIENVSSKLNEPLGPSDDQFSLDSSQVTGLFQPLNDWASDLTTIDYTTLAQAALPGWIITLQNTLNAVGINIQVADIIEALFDPFVRPIKDAIKAYAIDQVQMFIGQLVDEVKAKEAVILAEYDGKLAAAAHPMLTGGNAVDNFFNSGIYGYSFNITAATFANHAVVLPVGNHPVGVGPSTFDASHSLSWMQAGVCDYLREAIFPFGTDVKGILTVRQGGEDLEAQVTDDSPIECHDGSLSEFTQSPSQAVCSLIDLEGLKLDPAHQGSVSRSHPPSLSDVTVMCDGIDVPGLPPPPAGVGGTGGGSGGGAGSPAGGTGGSGTSGAGGDGGSSVNATKPNSSSGDDGGCGCRVARPETPTGAAWSLALLALAGAARRRRMSRGC